MLKKDLRKLGVSLLSNRVNLIRFTQITFIEKLYIQKHCQLELKRTEAMKTKQGFGPPNFYYQKAGWVNYLAANTFCVS